MQNLLHKAIYVVLLATTPNLAAQTSPGSHLPFLEKYCFSCHSESNKESDYRFDQLGDDLSDLQTLEVWQAILDQLNLGEMPPIESPKPDATAVEQVIESLTASLQAAYQGQKSTGGKTVIRRLNKYELRNTLRDLFHLKHPDFAPQVVSGLYDFNGNGITAQKTIEPTRSFQDDEEVDGFDNIGQELVMSDFLLKMLIEAAEESIEMATQNEPPVDFEAETFIAPICTKTLHGDSLGKYQRAQGNPYDEVFQRWDRYNRIGPDKYHGGIRRPAEYRITVEISAHQAQPENWGDWTVREGNLIHRGRTSPTEPFEVGLYLERYEHLRGERRQRIASWRLPADGQKRTFSYDTWIDNPWSTWIGWENGPWFQHNAWHILLEQWYPEDYSKLDRKQKDFKKQVADILFEKGYRGPTLRIHSYRVEPIPSQWPPVSHAALFGSEPIEQANLPLLFKRFAERAYRRPVEANELDRYIDLVTKLESEGNDRQSAMQVAYVAILCSPDFLYLKQHSGKLDDYELASRLSYFLWSSMPDETLFDLAASGRLSNPEELHRQVERLLKDPKARAFTHHFPERWLKLFELGRMEPDKKGPYGHYFRVKDFLIPQVEAYFRDVLHRNAPIRDLIDSDYTFMNHLLGELIYKQEVVGKNLHRVQLEDQRRGGLLTMPAVMTVTANGVDTSPIVRGVYILENLLGSPPPPPPPDVEPLATDLRSAKTIKQQIEIHRNQPACNRCHRKIDPMGFAFESLDPIGRWRTHYPRTGQGNQQASMIDTSSVMPSGQTIKDLKEFKSMLLDREPDVARCLTTKLLTYATGRTLEPNDRGEVNRIVGELENNGYRLRDLIHLIVESQIFLTK